MGVGRGGIGGRRRGGEVGTGMVIGVSGTVRGRSDGEIGHATGTMIENESGRMTVESDEGAGTMTTVEIEMITDDTGMMNATIREATDHAAETGGTTATPARAIEDQSVAMMTEGAAEMTVEIEIDIVTVLIPLTAARSTVVALGTSEIALHLSTDNGRVAVVAVARLILDTSKCRDTPSSESMPSRL
jgi:hypothetical protein